MHFKMFRRGFCGNSNLLGESRDKNSNWQLDWITMQLGNAWQRVGWDQHQRAVNFGNEVGEAFLHFDAPTHNFHSMNWMGDDWRFIMSGQVTERVNGSAIWMNEPRIWAISAERSRCVQWSATKAQNNLPAKRELNLSADLNRLALECINLRCEWTNLICFSTRPSPMNEGWWQKISTQHRFQLIANE